MSKKFFQLGSFPAIPKHQFFEHFFILAVGKVLKIRGPSPTLITPKKISKWPLTDQFEKLTPRARRFCRDETDSKILIHKEFEDEWKEEHEKENKQVWRITRVPSEKPGSPCFTLFSQAINKVNKRKPDPIIGK